MAFVQTIHDPEDDLEIIFLFHENEILARMHIGFDDETDATYSILVALTQSAISTEVHEIHFNVIEAFFEDGKELENWCKDGLHTRRFLPADYRQIVRSCICTCVQALLERRQPEIVAMYTVTPNLPEKALQKYEEVCKAGRACGYEAGRDSPYLGTNMWLMRRAPDGTEAVS